MHFARAEEPGQRDAYGEAVDKVFREATDDDNRLLTIK